MVKSVKIILVVNHALFRKGMRQLIEEEEIGEVLAEAENGKELIDLLKIYTPDLVLMDIEMPVMDGLEATRNIRETYPDLKILILTMLNLRDKCNEIMNAGANGFVLKTSDKTELEKAIKSVTDGKKYSINESYRTNNSKFEIKEKSYENQDCKITEFSDRELKILQYFCKGLPAIEIADKLFKSIKTIESDRTKLLQKTNSKNTINLILFAIKHKLVDIYV